MSALALLIGAVIALIANFAIRTNGCALVKFHTVLSKRLYKLNSSTGNLALSIGILNTKIEYAVRKMSKSLIDHRSVNTAEMNKARGAGRKARYLSSLRKIARRISVFNDLTRIGYVREK